METTEGVHLTDGKINVVHPYKGLMLSKGKQQSICNAGNNEDKCQRHYIKSKKSDLNYHIPY
jgi:hypothetical protein